MSDDDKSLPRWCLSCSTKELAQFLLYCDCDENNLSIPDLIKELNIHIAKDFKPISKLIAEYIIIEIKEWAPLSLDFDACSDMPRTSVMWHGQVKFMIKLLYIQSIYNDYVSIVERNSIGSCFVCNNYDIADGVFILDRSKIDQEGINFTWPISFLGHSIFKHNAIPSKEFYDFVMLYPVDVNDQGNDITNYIIKLSECRSCWMEDSGGCEYAKLNLLVNK